MGSQTSAEAAQVVDAIRRLVRALRASAHEAQKRTGVSGAQLFVLQKLREGTLSLGELAQRTLTHQSSVSVVVQRLVSGGYVTRKRSGEDARRVEIALTAKGRGLLKRIPPVFQDQLIASLGKLTPARRKSLAQGLHALIATMGLEDVEPEMFFEER